MRLQPISTIASWAGGPLMPDQGWTLRAQTHCQAKHRLMPCSGILESMPERCFIIVMNRFNVTELDLLIQIGV